MAEDNLGFVASPPFAVLRNRAERDPDDQRWIIREIRTWLENNLWRDGLCVAFDHDWAPDGHSPEQPSIFSGRKIKNSGWETCNGAVDILVRDDRGMSIPVIVEVEPSLSPKRVFGDVGAVVASDRHVPSLTNSDSLLAKSVTDFYLQDTLFVVLTFGQAEGKIRRMEDECNRMFSFPNSKVREFHISSAATKEEAVANCKRFLKMKLFPEGDSVGAARCPVISRSV